MSTSSIQAQLGYTAQASPANANSSGTSERNLSYQPPAERTLEPFRAPKSLPPPADPISDAKPVADAPRPELKHMTRKTDIDWTTNSLVYRVIDNRSGQVVSQSPDEALLRLRAYAKQALTQSEATQIGEPRISREL